MFDMATAEIVSCWPEGGVSGPLSSKFLPLMSLPDDGLESSSTNTSCTTFVPSISRKL